MTSDSMRLLTFVLRQRELNIVLLLDKTTGLKKNQILGRATGPYMTTIDDRKEIKCKKP